MGGLGLPVVLAWPVGALFAAGVAWLVGKVSLGLRSDYLAIATLGISEIVIAVLKFEGWMSRGVNNVTGIDRPRNPARWNCKPRLGCNPWPKRLVGALARPPLSCQALAMPGCSFWCWAC